MPDQDIVLYGAGGHGKVIENILQCIGENQITFWDDEEKHHFLSQVSKPSIKKVAFRCIISIGHNKTRKMVSKTIQAQFMEAIHPAAIVALGVTIGMGTVVMAGAVINPGVHIGVHCIINTAATIDHDCHLESFVHISPGAHLAGDVHIGEGTLIGMGSNIIQGVTIGKWATVGAGSVILKNVPDYAVVVGVPGRIINYNPKATEDD
jgi:sugar O-acyltransferase (sialic acid O-acetyltransferase NeuD family)